MISPVLPELSVVIFTPDSYETIRQTIAHLQQQTVRERLEILIAVPSRDDLRLDESDLEPFFRWRVVEVGPVQLMADAKAAAVQQATAPLIVFAEDHSFPEAGWAAALIAAHQEGWAAVAPAICNANPETMISWAALYLDFGPWVEPAAAGPVNRLPWHNASYRRDLLLDYGTSLNQMLAVEFLLQSDLQARGYSLYLNSAARTQHLNFAHVTSLMAEQFHGARAFAAYRARYGRWPAGRRLLYIAGAPLIPLVALRRVLGHIRRSGRQKALLPRLLPVLTLGLACSGVGEMLGYALGAGAAARKKSAMESHRERHLMARRPPAKGME